MTILITFALFMLGFVGVGLLSTRQKTASNEDYLVASRQIHPWLMALSAVATNNSGFMFIGLIGFTYTSGISSLWLMFGWVLGDYLAWLAIHRRLREKSEARNVSSVPEFLGWSKEGPLAGVASLASLLTIAFLGVYAAAQLKAGNTALEALFNWPAEVGVLLSALVIAVYCFAGGLRASIWTNTAQAVVMLGAMFALLAAVLVKTGGLRELWSQLAAIDPALVNLRPQKLEFGFGMFVFSWIVAGIGVIGQPHIMTIAMSLDDAGNMRRARRVYFVWYVAFSAACILVGLGCRVLLPVDAALFNQEQALPLLSQLLLPDVLIGLMLAGLFAATISTADTQILCCNAALTRNLAPLLGATYLRTKISTLVITTCVASLALYDNENVFALVVLAWSALASSLGPLLAVQAFGGRVSGFVGCGMMIAGLSAALYWKYGLNLGDDLYEVLPGMAAGFAFYLLGRLFLKDAAGATDV